MSSFHTYEHKLPSITQLLTLSPRPEPNQRLSPDHSFPSISPLALPFRPVSPPCEDTLPPLQGDDPPQRLVRPSPAQSSPEPLTPAQSPVAQPPVLKRRRGRPPNLREPIWEGGWVFLAPTVWEVNPGRQPAPLQQKPTSFTSDHPALLIPRKKRGRKPKHHIVGHSCFVWKELTSTRTPKPKKVSSSTPNLRRLRKAPEQTVE
ncbi:hypothetical protein CLU79DRAFT_888744, partial [Phycomyces nitens]